MTGIVLYWTQSAEKHDLDKRLAVFSAHLVSNKNAHAERGVSCSQAHIRIEEVRCDGVFLVHSCFPAWLLMSHL